MTNEESMSNIMVEMGAIIESIQDILDGKEVSDFMMSFPIVREVWDLKHSAQVCTEPNQPVDLHKKIMNIPVDADNMQLAVEEASKECTWARQMEYLYKLAYRDVRRAAAEIVAGRWRKVSP